MTATTSVRSAVKLALFKLLEPAYAAMSPPVPTFYGWPGHELEQDEVYIVGPAPGTGNEAYPVMMAGRKHRDDIFVVSVVMGAVAIAADNVDSVLAADVRAEALFKVLEDALAVDQSLGSLDGVISVLLGPAVSGPDGEVIPIGARSTIVSDVTVHSRLH